MPLSKIEKEFVSEAAYHMSDTKIADKLTEIRISVGNKKPVTYRQVEKYRQRIGIVKTRGRYANVDIKKTKKKKGQ